VDTPCGREGSEGSKGSKGSEGKVDGALGPEGCSRLSAAGCVEGLWKRVVEKGFLGWTGLGHTCGVRVLKMDGPSAQGFLGLTAFQAEGCGIARRAMSIKSALRDLLSVSYGVISILRIGSLRSPPKGENCGMVHEIYDSLFFLSILLVSP